ncbi:site-specific integrase [Pedobacter sp. NJ-S-72]
MSVESYLNYLQHEKRYSPHTVTAYGLSDGPGAV